MVAESGFFLTMPSNRRVQYKFFRGTLATWDELFTQAAEFATTLEQGSLITISHSADQGNGVVTVWYWAEVPVAITEERKAAARFPKRKWSEG